jgi:HlyD family secretion protein
MHKNIFVWVCSICIIGAILLFWLSHRDGDTVPSYEAETVLRGTVEYVVSVTGRTEPAQRLELGFVSGGRVQNMYAKEGEYVTRGTLLATLENPSLQTQIQEAEARLAREEALYAELIAPLRLVSSELEGAKVTQAEQALRMNDGVVRAVLEGVYSALDDALHREIDTLYEGAPSNPRFGIQFESAGTTYNLQANFEKELRLNELRREVSVALVRMRERSVQAEGKDLSMQLKDTEDDLRRFEMLCTELAQAINRYMPDSAEELSVYTPFQSAVQRARLTVTQKRAEIAQTLSTRESLVRAYERAERERDVALAGARFESVQVQQASIAVAKSALLNVRARASDAELRAPIAGRVVSVVPSVGELVRPFDAVCMLEGGEGQYQIEVYIPEVDIARVQLGNPAKVTFDAFGREVVFTAEVTRIALVETVREGVPTYKTTLFFTEQIDPSYVLRPGMTADIDISTEQRIDVLKVPTRSVLGTGTERMVRVVSGGMLTERRVEVGLRGSDGATEIRAGLQEGDEVVVYMEE